MVVRKNSIILTLSFLLVVFIAYGTDKKQLSKNELLSIVRQYHPVVRQASVFVERSGAQLLQARGNFDPVLGGEIESKSLDGKQYYNYFNSQITIPTWYGIDLKAGFEDISGDRISPESSLGQTSYLGVKFSANSLLFDARRATLAHAKLFCKQSEAERRVVVNNIMYDALAAYWNWVREYQNYSIISNTIRVNEERLRFIRVEFQQGARPAIDTTEALLQLQTFYVQQQSALLACKNAGIELSGFMWLEENTPYNWSDDIVPDSSDIHFDVEIPALTNMLEAIYKHPKLEAIGYKINSQKIDQKLKFQYFIPKLSLNANLLGKGYYENLSVTTTQFENNHKLGISLNLPLLYREALGGYKASRLKTFETELEKSHFMLQLETKVKMYYNEVLSLKTQIEIFSSAFDNYRKLYAGEKFRFDQGESSLFLLNSRESKLLEAAQKLIELKTKWHKSYAGLLWACGQLN
ncbi:MAG: TolC family protein [Bacteroidetes bacterium]|nr:TolC family protein [Bacteroidota bacterium]